MQKRERSHDSDDREDTAPNAPEGGKRHHAGACEQNLGNREHQRRGEAVERQERHAQERRERRVEVLRIRVERRSVNKPAGCIVGDQVLGPPAGTAKGFCDPACQLAEAEDRDEDHGCEPGETLPRRQ
jgi:hypothetical protein